MLAKVLSSAVFGIDAYVVEVEVDIEQSGQGGRKVPTVHGDSGRRGNQEGV